MSISPMRPMGSSFASRKPRNASDSKFIHILSTDSAEVRNLIAEMPDLLAFLPDLIRQD